MKKIIFIFVLLTIFSLNEIVTAENLNNLGVSIKSEFITYSTIKNFLIEGNGVQYKFVILNTGNKNLTNLELLYEISTSNKDAPPISDKLNFNKLDVNNSKIIYTNTSYYLAYSGPYTLKLYLKSDQGDIPIDGVINWFAVRHDFRVWPSTIVFTSLISLFLVILYFFNLRVTQKSFHLSRLPLVTTKYTINNENCYNFGIIFKNISNNFAAKDVKGIIRIVYPLKQKLKDRILDNTTKFLKIHRKNIINFSILSIYPTEKEKIILFDKLREILPIQVEEYTNENDQLITTYKLNEDTELRLYIKYYYSSDMGYYTPDFEETLHIKIDKDCNCRIVNNNKLNIW